MSDAGIGPAAASASHRCWISLGSNIDREASLRGAVADLRRAFGDLVLSPVYESAAVGASAPPYLNLVAGIETALPVVTIVTRLRAIEQAHGRLRGPDRFAARTLDLDLLTYGDQAGVIDGLHLPRDEILAYPFVLGPLADVAPAERHPQLGRSYRSLWQERCAQMAPLVPYPLVL
ncbi:MAG: 2-amino-4-hydroxy-6-hydroxymethyldihydropteridine diphosphokinase [Chromatiaceae bacterium]|nr:MAG: 2-amino-4-hydroxy-6-hydroxymethyldihydropteridine diphosphokinase [Chromatiaceae bacterium]